MYLRLHTIVSTKQISLLFYLLTKKTDLKFNPTLKVLKALDYPKSFQMLVFVSGRSQVIN